MAVSEMTVKLGVLMEDFTKGLSKATSQIQRFATDLKRIGKTLTSGVTVPIAGIAFAAFKASAEATAIFKRFGERVKEIFGRLGDNIAKAINLEAVLEKVANVLDRTVNWFENLSASTQTAIVSIAALIALLGPLATILSKLVSVGLLLLKVIMAIGAFILSVKGAIIIIVALIVGGILKATGAYDALKNWISGSTKALNQQEVQARRTAKAWEDLKKTIKPTETAGRKFQEEGIQFPWMGPRQGEIIKAMAAGGEISRLGEWKNQVTLFTNVVNFLRTGFLQLGEGAEKAIAKIRPLGGMGKFLADGIRKFREEIGNTFGELERRITEAEARMKVEGGGVNLVEVARSSAIQSYGQLAAMGLSETDSRMAGLRTQIEGLSSAWMRFLGLMMETPPIAEMIATSLKSMVDTFIQGVGDAVGRAIVYGESLSEAMMNLLKQIAASIISMIIQIVLNWVIAKVAHSLVMMTELVAGLKTYAALTYATVFAANAGIPIIGPWGAAALAAKAVGMMLGGAAGAAALGAGVGAGMGVAGGAEGGIFSGARPFILAEVGRPEIALTQENVDRFFGGRMRGGLNLTIPVQIDGREVGRAAVRYGPAELRRQGI